MKAAQLFRQYIWIINALRVKGKLTLSQMNKMWMDDCMTNGNPLARTSFNRHREAIQDLFGVVIDCEEKTYLYYISNPRVLSDDGLGPWLFSTMTVHGVLADMLAERLGIANKWKFFEQLWLRNNMRGDYNTALDQKKSLEFQERLKNILG